MSGQNQDKPFDLDQGWCECAAGNDTKAALWRNNSALYFASTQASVARDNKWSYSEENRLSKVEAGYAWSRDMSGDDAM